MRDWKKILIAGLLILVIVAGGVLYLGILDTLRIKKLLKTTEEAFEHEELDKLMSYVSLKYSDGYGFNYPMVKRLMSGLFQDFDQFEATVENPVIKIEEDTATIQFSLWITVDWNGTPSYIVGTNRSGAPVKVYLRKELLSWKVVRLEGVIKSRNAR